MTVKHIRICIISLALGALSLFVLGIWIFSKSPGEQLDSAADAGSPNENKDSPFDPQRNEDAKRSKLPATPETIDSSHSVPESDALVPGTGTGEGVAKSTAALSSGASAASEGAGSLSAMSAEPESERVPVAWNINSADDPRHKLTSDTSDVWNGSSSALMTATQSGNPYLGSFMWQAVSAANYKGSRVRFSAYLKTDAATFGAYLVLRAEDRMGNVIAFDNMEGRWTGGNSGWQGFADVLDIPATADVLIYGVGLARAGSVRIDSAALETVDKGVRVTSAMGPTGHINPPLDKTLVLPAPTNMDFELSAESHN
jgi:hypothetical protein